ncbi:MAG: hypothetical protein VW438_00495, partial [Euryarchaeota archaeon]
TDESIQILCASFVGGLARFSEEEFVGRAQSILARGNQKATQRLVESGLRDYLSTNPTDPAQLLSSAWLSSSEIGHFRLGNLIESRLEFLPKHSKQLVELSKKPTQNLSIS